MRMYHIALFFMIFNLMGYLVASVGIFPVSIGNVDEAFLTADEVEKRAQATESTISAAVSESPTDIGQTIIFTLRGFTGVIGAIVSAPFALPLMMSQLGAPSVLTLVIGIILGFVYIIAVYQIWFQRGIKDDE